MNDLRASLHAQLDQPRDQGTGTMSSDAVATLLWGLQAAQHVGVAHQQALAQLTHGEARVWIAGDELSQGTRAPAIALATSRLMWVPDEQGLHSARPLLDASSHALRSLQDARDVAHQAIGSSRNATPSAHPHAPGWEVVDPPDPIRHLPEARRWPVLEEHLGSRRQIGP